MKGSGRYPRAGEASLAAEAPASTQADGVVGSCRPDTAVYAFKDCLIAFSEIGRDDVAENLRLRWSDVRLEVFDV